MADTTYQPKIYRKQGGDELYVASGGQITTESGGEIEIESGGTLDVQSGATFTQAGTLTNTGTIANSSDGKIYDPVVVQNTTASLIPAYGCQLIGSTAAGALAYSLSKPTVAGQRKTLLCRNSTGACTVKASTATATACKFRRTLTKITFGASADNTAVDLIAETSTSWSIVGWSTDWTTTIKCT